MKKEWGARNFRVGQRWKITEYAGTRAEKSFVGHVFCKTKYFVVLKTKKDITESFMYTWMNAGRYVIKKLN